MVSSFAIQFVRHVPFHISFRIYALYAYIGFAVKTVVLLVTVCLLWLYLSLFEIVPSSLEKLSSEMSVPSKLQSG